MEESKLHVKEKKKNPFDNANIISSIFFIWIIPFFIKGYSKGLTEDDIYQHRKDHDSGKLGDKLEEAWIRQKIKNKNSSIIKAFAATFYGELVILNIGIILQETIRLFQPYLITKLIRIFDGNRFKEKENEVYLYAGLIILTSLIAANINHLGCMALMQTGMKMRVAACSLIYRKSLKLGKSALTDTTVGQMVNLLSNDVARFETGIFSFHNLYIAPIELVIVMCLLYINVGWTALSGAIMLLFFIPFQYWLGKKTSEFRLNAATKTDERVRLMNEIISGIQVIKMYTWEIPFTKLVKITRNEEMQFIEKTSVIRAIVTSGVLILNKCAVAACILVYVFNDNALTATYAYTVTSYYKLLYTLTNFFPSAVNNVSEMYVSAKRIERFLLNDEIENKTTTDVEELTICGRKGEKLLLKVTIRKNDDVGIRIKNASAKWTKSLPGSNIQDINMDISSNNITAVIGPVGSGKTTLLHIIMNELELECGSVKVNGVISYAPQEPWIFGRSIKQNILFGQKFDQCKYDKVIRVCALYQDFNILPFGDQTLVGERGIALSGGQKARVSLARAIYRDADIYLLDDPLSALDSHVGKHIFEECICSYLRKKCVVLVTHQLHYLKDVETIFLMNNGRMDVSGSFSYLISSNNIFSKLLSEIEEEDHNISNPKKINESVSEDINQIQAIQSIYSEENREEKKSGYISGRIYLNYIKSGGNIKFFGLVTLFLLSQFSDTVIEYYVMFWVNTEYSRKNLIDLSSIQNTTIHRDSKTQESNSNENWWLAPLFNSDNTAMYYGFFMIFLITITICRSLVFFKWCLTASSKLHNTMLNNIVHSPMNFFHLNPSGRILNRFSKDIGALDEILPLTLLETIQTALTVLSCAFIIGSLSIWISTATIIVGILFYVLRMFYSKTSRDIKRLESITRSPIFSHLSISIQGLSTIRAFKNQNILIEEFDNLQNTNSAAYFLYVAGNRAFGFWLDILCIVYIGLVLTALLCLESETFGGNMGLALSQSMSLTGVLQWGMRQWSEFENQMTSVERVQEYVDQMQEFDNHSNETDDSWPKRGWIEFRNLCLRYKPEEHYVLKNLNFAIKPNEKVGIVGRTGAGKSSLIQAIFRLAHIEGSILIDGIDTKTISLKQLRSKISIIPQEPVLFSGTLRSNLDPFDQYDDEDLWIALKEVELDATIDLFHEGLDTKIAEGGSNFSVGQKQLICLARATLRKNKILILDEATANVDPQTDHSIQITIRKKFVECTVLTVAHRLNTIMDSDRVLVMDAGEVVEFDHPHSLLQNKNGLFYSMVQKTGKSTAKNLKHIAREKYKTRIDDYMFL